MSLPLLNLPHSINNGFGIHDDVLYYDTPWKITDRGTKNGHAVTRLLCFKGSLQPALQAKPPVGLLIII